METKKLRVALPVVALAATAVMMPTASAVTKSADPAACVPIKEGVSYAYKHDASTASITLEPLSGPRCEDVTVSVTGWKYADPSKQYPQTVTDNKTVTLKADATGPVTASVPANCQNDAYWGAGPDIGTTNERGGYPFQEIFVNWMLPIGTGADWSLMPITNGLTASRGPCGEVSPPSPTVTPTPSPTTTPTSQPGSCRVATAGVPGCTVVAGPQVVEPPVANPPSIRRPQRLPHTGF